MDTVAELDDVWPLWEKAGQYPDLQAVAEGSFRLLMDTVAELIDDPEDDKKLLIATNSAWSIVHGLASLLLDGQICTKTMEGISYENLTDRVVEPLVHGLMSVSEIANQ